jgi:hypothetical protein
MEKKCKHCAMLVPEDAKICPYCRKRLTTSFAVKALIAFFLIAAAMSAMTGRSTIPTFTSQTTNAVPEISLTDKGKKVKVKHPAWSNEECNAIAKKSVHQGMTTEQAQAAWGKPYKINSTNYGNHTREQWVMHEYGSSYLYFEDGILTTIQTSK